MGCDGNGLLGIAGRWCCLGAPLLPLIESLQLGVVAEFGGARRTQAQARFIEQQGGTAHQGAGDRQHLLVTAREAAGQLLASGADLFPDHLRRITLIRPSALAQTNSLGSIGGQKEEMRDVVRRPPCTERLTATDSAPPPRESAMGCSRCGPSATVTPNTQLYCEACFMVSNRVCIRTMMYASVLIHGLMDDTSPPGSCKEIEKSLRRYRVRLKSQRPHLTIPQFYCTACPLEQVAGYHRLHRPTMTPTAEWIPDPPIQRKHHMKDTMTISHQEIHDIVNNRIFKAADSVKKHFPESIQSGSGFY